LSPEKDLLIPLADSVEMAQVTPDVRALVALGQRMGIQGFCLFTTRTRDPASHVQSRFFAPHYGVPEDPATGSVHGPLALYLWRYGLLQPHGQVVSLVGEQGEAIGRPSRVRVEVALRDSTVRGITPSYRDRKRTGYFGELPYFAPSIRRIAIPPQPY
jgi:trans-2,3-dihydro-3-hydroxyanthranilate isomerase